MKISINEPCHENWETMTPNQQGAFCKSCMKDVVDFSKKSLEDIKAFFSKPQEGRVCGRFEEKQLQELSFDDFFAKFTYWNFAKKFAVIFFMAFGFWIFSNSTAMGQTQHLKGEVAYIPEKPQPVKKDTAKKQTRKPLNQQKVLMGKIKCVKPMPLVDPEPVKEPEPMMLGAVVAIQEPEKIIEPVKVIEIPAEDTTKSMVEYFVLPNNVVDAVPVADPEIKTTALADGTEGINNTNDLVIIYPNPGNGNFILETKADAKQTVHIIDANGKLVLTKEISGSTSINASSLPAGIYTVNIIGSPTEGVVKKRLVIIK